MSNFKRTLAISIIISFSWRGHATLAVQTIDFSQKASDYSELKKLIAPYIFELKHAVTVYSWSKANDESQLHADSTNPAAYAVIKNRIDKLWVNRTNKKEEFYDYIGETLYTAVDPIITRRYGGTDKRWILIQVQLPKGFKILQDSFNAHFVPREKRDLLVRLGCPKEWQSETFHFQDFLRPTSGYPNCENAIRGLIKDDLKIDGFAYPFAAFTLKNCVSQRHESAIAILSTRKIGPENVKVFNYKTKDAMLDRLRILGFGDEVRQQIYNSQPTDFVATLWPDLKASNGPDIRQWIKENSYFCQ